MCRQILLVVMGVWAWLLCLFSHHVYCERHWASQVGRWICPEAYGGFTGGNIRSTVQGQVGDLFASQVEALELVHPGSRRRLFRKPEDWGEPGP